jgi:hypothetical protein
MSTAQLFNIPRDRESWAFWSHANADSHNLIARAIQRKNPGLQLVSFVLDPMPFTDFKYWALRHQLMHDQFEQVLGIGGNDYTEVDPTNREIEEYIWQQHANEHIQAELKAGVSV